MATRDAHFAFIKETGVVKLGGPFLDAAGNMAGSLIIFEAADLAAAKAWHAKDPYARAGLFVQADIRPWKTTVKQLRRKALEGNDAMAYWLFKTEPETWSWEMQKKKGAKGEPWSGVRNFTGCQQYESDEERRSRLLLSFRQRRSGRRHRRSHRRISSPDPTDETGRFGLVDVKAVEDVPKPVTLAEVKANPKLAQMALVKFSRLSVQPVTPAEWKIVCSMGGMK